MRDTSEIRWFADQLDYSHSWTTDKEHIYQLSLKAREIDAQNILELGSFLGVSTAVLAYACPNAKVYAVDVGIAKDSPSFRGVPNSYREDFWRYLGLKNITAIEDFADHYVISCKKANITFDFVFHDADHGDKVIPEYLVGYDILNKGGYFVSHDWDAITSKKALIEHLRPSEMTVLKDDKNRELLMLRK